jgi:predicted ATPase
VVEAYLAALALDPPEDVSVFLVDEPGSAFYPPSMQRPAELLTALSASKQVIVATHATDLIDSFADVSRTWILERPAGHGTVLQRMSDVDDVEAELVRVGLATAAMILARTMSRAAP